MVHQLPNSLTIRDIKEHGRRRRVIQEALADASVRAFLPDLFLTINRFCDRLLKTVQEEQEEVEEEKKKEQEGESATAVSGVGSKSSSSGWRPPRNMAEWCSYLGFDLMTSFIFSAKYNLLEKDQYRYVPGVVEASNVRVSTVLQAPILRLCRLDKLLFPRAIASRNLFLGFVGKLLRDTERADRTGRRDLLERFSHAKDPETGRGFSHQEKMAEAVTLVVAGGDTSATAMAAVFFYLSRHPPAYARARDEVRSAFATVDDIRAGAGTGELNEKCRYLRACIDEAMRMSPSVGQSLSREVPRGGAVVDGHLIPEGCEVGVPIYSIHHNERYFPDPFDYCPERWLQVSQDGSETATASLAAAADMYAAYNPFSVGPRSCMGKGVALVELLATFAVVLHRLEFKMAAGDRSGGRPENAPLGRHRADEFQLRDHITCAKDGPMLRFRAASPRPPLVRAEK